MKAASIDMLSSFPTDGRMPGVRGAGAPEGADSFSQAISNAVSAGASNAAAKQMAGSDAGVKVAATAGGTGNSRSEGRSASSVNEKSNADKRTDSRDVKANDPDRKESGEAVSKTAEKISDEIEEKFGISEEELEEAMEVLGLTMADLFDASALTQLYAQLSGAEDAMSILTDESMYAGLQELLSDVSALTEQLMDTLGVDEEGLSQLVGDFVVSEDVVSEEASAMVLEAAEDAPEEEAPALMKTEKDGELSQESDQAAGENVQISDERMQTGRSEGKKDDRGRDSDGAFLGQAQNAYNTDPVAQQTAEVSFENVSYSSEQTREIARQLVEQIRVNVTQETTSLDMVLNPASLGHVALNIEAKNGVITAAFTAQNEAVRAVIENQMMVLRENLESQGIRIEAVEVTVSSQAFDQNLERGREENRQRDEAQAAVRVAGRRRQINLLAGADEDEEAELTEEEEINRDMMIRSGNSMDVTA